MSTMYEQYTAVYEKILELLSAMGVADVPSLTDQLEKVPPDLHLATALLHARVPDSGNVPRMNGCYTALKDPNSTPGLQIAALGLMLHEFTITPELAEHKAHEVKQIKSALRIIALRELLHEETDGVINVFIPEESPVSK